MERFVKMVSGFYSLIIFEKYSILDVWQDSEYVSVIISRNSLPFFLRILEHLFLVSKMLSK